MTHPGDDGSLGTLRDGDLLGSSDRTAADVAGGLSWAAGAYSLRTEYLGTYFRDPQASHGARVTGTWRF